MSSNYGKMRANVPVAEIRQQIIEDAFCFYRMGNGAASEIVDFSGLEVSAGDHPTPEVMSRALIRCERVWKEYCRRLKLPGETHRSFMKAFEKQWRNLESPIKKRKRKGTTS